MVTENQGNGAGFFSRHRGAAEPQTNTQHNTVVHFWQNLKKKSVMSIKIIQGELL